MEFGSKEFSVILRALNEHIYQLRHEIEFSNEQLEKNKSNDDLVSTIKKNIIEHKNKLEDAETTLLKLIIS